MAGPLNTFFAGVALSPQLAGVTLAIGKKQKSIEGAPPRLLFTPMKERFAGPAGYAGDSMNVPRTIWRRIVPIEIEAWASSGTNSDSDDTDATEALVQATLQAVHQQSWNGFYYEAIAGEWVDGALTALGKKYLLTIEIMIPVTMPPDAEATIATFTETTVRVDPITGVIETGV